MVRAFEAEKLITPMSKTLAQQNCPQELTNLKIAKYIQHKKRQFYAQD